MHTRQSQIFPVMLALLLVTLLGSLGWAGGQDVSPFGNPYLWVTIGDVKVKAEVVRTPERHYLGLSHRQSLPEGQGMLFFMPATKVQNFCMRGMHFPLDFLWIVEGRVAGIEKNVPANSPGEITSPVPVNYVLEVPAGFADRYGIKVGDHVTWQ